MADDLQRLLNTTRGEGPSPEFVAGLRTLVLEEAGESGESGDDRGRTVPVVPAGRDLIGPGEADRPGSGGPDDGGGDGVGLAADELPGTDITRSRGDTSTDRRFWPWNRMLLAAAVLAVIAGIGVVLSTRPDTDQSLETFAPVSPTSLPGEPPVESGPASLDSYLLVEEGEYVLDVLGTPLSFTTDTPLLSLEIVEGYASFGHVGNDDSVDRTIVLTRVTALSDPTQPAAAWASSSDGWPVEDWSGWLDNLVDEIEVTDRGEATVGGRTAQRADLTVGAIECGDSFGCVYLGTNSLGHSLYLERGAHYRVYVVDQGAEDPIMIMSAAGQTSDLGWLDTVDRILDTVELGDIAPNPVQVSGPGRVELDVFGGVRVDLDTELTLVEDPRGFDLAWVGVTSANTEFVMPRYDSRGASLGSTDELVEALSRAAITVTELDSILVDGLDARVFDLDGGANWPVLTMAPDATEGWQFDRCDAGRIWVIEHPERGLLMVVAANRCSQDLLPLAIARTEDVLDDLEFIDAG